MITRRQLLAGALAAPFGATLIGQAATTPTDPPWTEIPLQIDRHNDRNWPLLRYCKIHPVQKDEFLHFRLGLDTLMLHDGESRSLQFVQYAMPPSRLAFPFRQQPADSPLPLSIEQQIAFHKVMTARIVYAQAALQDEQSWGQERITTGQPLTEGLIERTFQTIVADTRSRAPLEIAKQDMRLVVNPKLAKHHGWPVRDTTIAGVPLVCETTFRIFTTPDGKQDKAYTMPDRSAYLLWRPGGVQQDESSFWNLSTLTGFARWDAMGQRDTRGTYIADHVGFAVTCPLTGWWFRDIA